MIYGETVTVTTFTHSGWDEFNEPVGEACEILVKNVLVAPASTTDLSGNLRPHGDRVALELHFPKSFTASLRGARVTVRGATYAVVGDPQPYTQANTPGDWWLPVHVERVDG